MKRRIAFMLALAAMLMLIPAAALAEPFDPNDISTPHVVLMDSASGNVLFEKNADERAFPASTTKIMTCILALEMCPDLDVEVTVGDRVETKGSCMNILPGERLSLRDLLYGMMLVSGNDAARAIAEYISGSESAFADVMNQKAAALGMAGTHFIKSNGLHEEEHYSTARDMAVLTRYAMRNAAFREIVSAKTYQVSPTNRDSDGYLLENTNRLLYTPADRQSYEYSYATGVKTGDTDYAGRCLVASAEKNGVELIAVIFGDPQGEAGRYLRFQTAASLFEWGFENYASLDASALGLEAEFTFPVSGGLDVTEFAAHAELSGVTITDTKARIAAIEANPAAITPSTALDRKLEAPIAAGEVIGAVAYQYEGATLFTADLVAAVEVAAVPVESSSPSPSASPLLNTPIDTESPEDEGGSSLVFWILLAVVLLALVVAAKVIASRRRRKRIARKRRAYRSNYTRR